MRRRWITKAVAFILTAVMLFTAVPFAAFAEDGGASPESETRQETQLVGTNALGDVIADAANEENEQTESQGGYGIFTVDISGMTASVSLSAPDNSNLVVAVYNENDMRMVTSGKAEVDSETSEVEVTLEECEAPEYYIIKAFLMNEQNEPVCAAYENNEHTRAYEEFFAKTVFDFDSEKVINLDYGYDDNFAVVTDDAVQSEQTDEQNILTTCDEENGLYVIENADEEIMSLHEGDIFYFLYGYGADEYILTKIGTIAQNGDTVTITAADECEMGELFSYIDIDTSKIQEAPKTRGIGEIEGEVKEDKVFPLASGEKTFSGSHYSLKLSMSASVTCHVKLYYNYDLFGPDYYKFEYWVSVDASAGVDFTISGEFSTTRTIITATLPIVTGLDIYFQLDITFKASASFTAKGTILFNMRKGGIKESSSAFQEINDRPSMKYEVEVNGEFAISLTPTITAGFTVLKVFFVDFDFAFEFKVSGTLFVPVNTSTDDSKKHNCLSCIDGSITLTINGKFHVDFGLKREKAINIIQCDVVNVTFTLGKFYVSLSTNGLKFDWGECPHITYKVTYQVVDANGQPVSGISVTDETETVTTDANGEAICYRANGTYNYSIDSSSYRIDTTQTLFPVFGVDGTAATVTIHVKDKGTGGTGENPGEPIDPDNPDNPDNPDEPDTPNTSGEKASGTCGENLTWVLYNDGELVISGTGEMNNYSNFFAVAPWYNYRGDIKTVHIKYGVASIGDWAFKYCSSLTSITIPDSVTGIGNSAFYNCSSLTSITIPDSVTSIGNSAFYNCSSLTSITIPDSVTSIGNSAFYNCSSLTSITIPNSVTSIGYYAFRSCSSLANFTVDGKNPYYFSDSYGVLFNKEKTNLLYYPAGNSNTSYEIPDSVTSIGDYAFADCSSLTSITIPDSVTNIGIGAFCDCSSLTSITIPDSITRIGGYAFKGCRSLTSITIPDSVTSIGDYAFSYCSSLTSITIPDSVTSIGYGAFYGCSSLTSITIPDSMTSIGDDAFRGCSSLTSITIPDSMTSIGDDAFRDCSSLTSITIPDGVTSIGHSAFCGCTGLTSITIPDSVTGIGDWTFMDCASLTSITIPDSVTSIGYQAFYRCFSLETVYYTGTEEQWNAISIGSDNGPLTSANIIYSSPATRSLLAARVSAPVMTALAYDGEVPAELSSTETLLSAVVGNSYIMLIVKDANAEDLLSPENLLYIDQKTADSDTLSFSFTPRETCDYDVIFAGAPLAPSEPVVHKHTYEITDSREATCTEDGYTTYTCTSCDDTYTQAITKLGHSYSSEWTIDTPATCMQTGSKSHHCIRCDAKTDVTTIPVTGHSYGAWVVTTAATCTADGVKTRTCSVCGATDTQTITKLGHSYSSEWTIDTPATCTQTGSKSHHCIRCDAKTDVTTIPANGHSYGDWTITTAVTCTVDGVKTRTCSVCGATDTQAITKLGHFFSSVWTIDIPASCTQSGSKSHHCTRCDAKTDATTIPANGHSYGDWTVTTAATCTVDGVKTRTCSVCGKTETQSIPAPGHVSEIIPGHAATCTETGLTNGEKCAVCGEILTAQTEIPASGHDYVATVTEATCTEDGYTIYTCSRCGDSYSETIPATGHDFGDWTVAIPATETSEGEEIRSCSICGKTETRSIPMLSPVPVEPTTAEPTTAEPTTAEPTTAEPTTAEPTTAEPTTAAPTTAEPTTDPITKVPTTALTTEEPSTEAPTASKPTTAEPTTAELTTEEPTGLPQGLLGDANGDGTVTAADARLILRVAAQLEPLRPYLQQVGDVDANGKLTAVDARRILRVAAKLDIFA